MQFEIMICEKREDKDISLSSVCPPEPLGLALAEVTHIGSAFWSMVSHKQTYFSGMEKHEAVL